MKIDSILVRQLTRSDFWNIEKPRGSNTGGGGQTYIDLPLGNIPNEALAEFLSVPTSVIDNKQNATINAIPIGTGNPSDLIFTSRGAANASRYRIINQNKNSVSSERHDGWKDLNGFPSLPAGIPDAASINAALYENIKLLVIKADDGRYFAGYTNSATIPVSWPQITGLTEIFDVSSSAIIKFSKLCGNLEVHEIFNAWKRKPNVLLYGPPGTGKTHLMNLLWKSFSSNETIQCASIDSTSATNPFQTEDISLPFDGPILTKWITFHQNYSYENFILATKPLPSGATFQLKPYAGSMLNAAISIKSTSPDSPKTAIIFIDELNRGNVSRIFGEFITFMDFEYREFPGSSPIPVPLNNLNNSAANRTEDIVLEDGTSVSLPIPWFFPKDIYILASMNSVDKAVAPLDSALSRRLHKINIFPNMEELAAILEISNTSTLLELREEDTTVLGNIKAEEVAWLLLYRLNYELSSLMGRDFELGHSYLFSISSKNNDNDKYHELSKIWDNLIYPQLQDRFSNRADEILKILRLDSDSGASPSADYLFKQKKKPLAHGSRRTVSPWTLENISLSKEFENNPAHVIYTLKFLSGLPI